MKNVEHINAELAKYHNELATLYKEQDDLLKERARGGVTDVDFKNKQKTIDLSFKTVRDRIDRFEKLRIYRKRTSDEGVILERDRLANLLKKRKRVAIKRAIEDLDFIIG